MFEFEETLRTREQERLGWRPEVDVFERPEGFLLCFSVPGVQEREIEVLTAGDVLIVRGVRELGPATEAIPRRLELPRGRFERKVKLPGTIDAEAVRTQLTQGLLLVHVPLPAGYVRVKVKHTP